MGTENSGTSCSRSEVPGFYRIVPLRVLRRTQGVAFDNVSVEQLGDIGAIDRVLHEGGAVSPGPVAEVERPWYMHPHQMDQLLVLHGKRSIELYSAKHGQVVSFEVTPDQILVDGELTCDGPGMLCWFCYVFHRVRSDERLGSASINFAVHKDGFDINTNFNVYALDTTTGDYRVIREGHLDQPD
jgi:hypothetical protein